MSVNTTEFIIDSEGKFFREDRTRYEIDPGDGLQRAFTKGVSCRIRNITEIPGYGPCHVVYENDTQTQHWSVPMNTINFRTSFAVVKTEEGEEVFPTFKDKKDTSEPFMEIEWNKADAMSKQDSEMEIRFVALVKPNGANYICVDHYLYAFDGRKAGYRLPIANLYETCQVCMGAYSSEAQTAVKAVEKALAQFRVASWNSDLFFDSGNLNRFIHFKPLEKGFQTLPILDGGWTTRCQKVSTGYMKFVEV